jgi:NADH-quinone oxidoreductase subunit C
MINFKSLIINQFGPTSIVSEDTASIQPSLGIMPEQIAEVALFLYSNEACYFDSLSCLTALDNGPNTNTMEVIYHLYSIVYEHSLVLKVKLPRQESDGSLPKINTVSHIWKTANWHEREAFDLLGINFVNHPDLRRILLPEDWQGHPLRKDYQVQESYHGIKVKA